MDNAMPQADNFAPFNFGVLGPEILWQAIGSFADDFQIAYDGIDSLSSFMKLA